MWHQPPQLSGGVWQRVLSVWGLILTVKQWALQQASTHQREALTAADAERKKNRRTVERALRSSWESNRIQLPLPKLVSHIRSERFLSEAGVWEVRVICRNMIQKFPSRGLRALSLPQPEMSPSMNWKQRERAIRSHTASATWVIMTSRLWSGCERWHRWLAVAVWELMRGATAQQRWADPPKQQLLRVRNENPITTRTSGVPDY